MSFTQKEIKEIKYSKRYGYVFSAMILAFGALFILLFSIMEKINFNDIRIIGLILLIVGLSALVFYGMNRKLNRDLKFEERIVEIKKIDKREKTIAYEVGSGSLHIPILGDMFPKIWGQEMKGHETYRLTVNGEVYDVEKDFYNSVNEGDYLEIHWSKYGEIFLGLKEKTKKPKHEL